MAKKPFLLHEPTAGGDLNDTLLILWHGAGGDVDNTHLLTLARGVADAGGWAARARFPYRVEGRRAPDRMPKLVAAARDTIAEIEAQVGEKPNLFLGGRSMGGRAASMLVAEGHRARGLVFLSYPLHPAGKKEKLRDAHLYDIEAPMLFLTGDKDALADMDLLRPVLAKLGDRATLEVWEKADHSFRRVDPEEAAQRTLAWIRRGGKRGQAPIFR